MYFKAIACSLLMLMGLNIFASKILIPMDEENQMNHLKAYGIAYWVLQNDIEVEWLLNYKGGSFLIGNYTSIQEECTIRGVSYEIITDAKVKAIKTEISDPEVNMEVVKLEKAPKIAVYTPQGKQPWDDAVTLVLTYAEIPYDEIYDKEVIENQLMKYQLI